MPKALGQWFIIGQHIIPVCSWSFAAVDDDADIMGHIIMPVIFSPVIECIDWHICIILLGVAAIGCTEASCSAVSFAFTCSCVVAAIVSNSLTCSSVSFNSSRMARTAAGS